MKIIKLTKGYETIVDDEDYKSLSGHKWYFNRYAYTSIKGCEVSMHRMLLGLERGDKLQGDHINHNKLDNRKENLRIVNQTQNMANTRAKGCHWSKERKMWRAMINIDGKRCHIGYYQDEDEAIKAHDEKNRELNGKYAFMR